MDTPHTPPALSALVDILASADGAAHGDADLAPHAAALAPLVATSPDLAPLVAAMNAGDRALARGELDVLAGNWPRAVEVEAIAVPDLHISAATGEPLPALSRLFVDISLVALDARSAWLRTSYGAADVDQARAFAAHTHRIAEAIFEAASSPIAEADPSAYLVRDAEAFDRQAETCDPHLVTASRELAAARHIAARLVRAYLAGESVDVLTAVRLTSSAEARAKLASDAAVGADEVLA